MSKALPRIILAGVIALSGCANLPIPWQKTGEAQTESVPPESPPPIPQPDAWWKNFNDPQLNALVDLALRSNNDFIASAIRVRRAQLQVDLTDRGRLPSFAAQFSPSATQFLDPPRGTSAHARNYSATFLSVNYEVDLWGKLSAQRENVRWEARATEADCQAYALYVVGATMRYYWQLAYLNQLLAFNAADIEYMEKTLALVRARHKAGAVSALNEAQAEQDLASQKAARTQLQQQYFEAKSALTLLLNQSPDTPVQHLPMLPDGALPNIGPGIPASVLAGRPDVHAAEMRLRSSLANIDYTRASFYPTLSLSGNLGSSSSTLIDLLRNPYAQIMALLTIPFNGKSMDLTVGISETLYDEAVVNFRQRMYTALSEVANALSARMQYMSEEEQLRNSLALAQRAESLSAARFKSGVTDIQPWLISQVTLRNAQRSLAANRLNQMNNLVNLYKALGLGSQATEALCR